MITLKEVSKTYRTKDGDFSALVPVSLEVGEGEIFGIIGQSGAGKSTILRMMNLLEKPSTGSVIVNGQNLSQCTPRELRVARRWIGMIFQHFYLLQNRTAADNIAFPLEISGMSKKDREKRVKECLEIVGLEDKASSYPAQLSGGQKQRVAIARALATEPKVLLCDEPTSALDPQTTGSILEFIRDINKRFGMTIVLVSHDMEVVKQVCGKIAVVEKGSLIETLDLGRRDQQPKTEIARLLLGSRPEVLKGVGAYV
ncbi:ATP-binding cassette domain-containing protein [Paenibacillus validus]|uniref:ATP-binding cassette domain-containing protein n=1 Tax=Paenibacillus validus TaxID=44253 RepID=A0A7X2Z988_9BACL|nr:ATP-binding cassette domain-containing protein [Paenibacillus validus]MED4599780.1 ATP-binding cassette domain-containing protein [Paenibacillus validus]MED4604685.1 ATP-binding cassette domain-containing protein [Paenibacillus validus]MUG70669.1 ATP-binding cassette domain-containing protein [Paenibacillus validus]